MRRIEVRTGAKAGRATQIERSEGAQEKAHAAGGTVAAGRPTPPSPP